MTLTQPITHLEQTRVPVGLYRSMAYAVAKAKGWLKKHGRKRSE